MVQSTLILLVWKSHSLSTARMRQLQCSPGVNVAIGLNDGHDVELGLADEVVASQLVTIKN